MGITINGVLLSINPDSELYDYDHIKCNLENIKDGEDWIVVVSSKESELGIGKIIHVEFSDLIAIGSDEHGLYIICDKAGEETTLTIFDINFIITDYDHN